MHPRPDGSCIATFPDAYTFVRNLPLWANDNCTYQCHPVVEKSFFQASPIDINVLILSSLNAMSDAFGHVVRGNRTALVAAFVLMSRKGRLPSLSFVGSGIAARKVPSRHWTSSRLSNHFDIDRSRK